MVNLSLRRSFIYWTRDFTNFKPPKGHVLLELDEEEMLTIGDTNLVLGYFEDNRNNTHWFGRVVAKNDVPLELGDKVWFSFLSGRGANKFIVGSSIFICLKYEYIVLRNNEGIEMLNDHYLSLPLPPKKHSFLEMEEHDYFYTEIAHAPKGGKYKAGDVVHYWMNQVIELEGQRKLLGKNYRLIREHGILAKMEDEEVPVEGMAVVKLDEPPTEKSGIILLKPKKRKGFVEGTVLTSTCDIEEGSRVLVNEGKGYAYGENRLYRKDDMIVIEDKVLISKGWVATEIYPSTEIVGNILVDKNTYHKREWLAKAKVLQSTCDIPVGADIYVRESRGHQSGGYILFRDIHVEAISE